MAHIFSNIVFALAFNSILVYFTENQISAASAQAFRFQMIVTCIAPESAGFLADRWGAFIALILFSRIGLFIAWIVLFLNKRAIKIQSIYTKLFLTFIT